MQLSKFLDNTISLSSLLETYRAYSNVNLSMQKERGYYSNAAQNLAITNKSANGYYDASYLNQVQYSSLLQFFKSLALIIAGATSGYVACDGLENIQKYILILGAILAVIAFVIYLLEISVRVHTRSRQFYWSRPLKNQLSQ